MDLLVRGGTLVEPEGRADRVDILIRDGHIAEVGMNLDAPGVRVLSATGKIVVPGLISAHTHVNSTLDRALSDGLPLELWRIATIYGGPRPTEREMYLISILGVAELVLSGCTALLDHVFVNPTRMVAEAGATAQACIDVGLRAVIAPLYSDMNYSAGLPMYLVPDAEGRELLDRSNSAPTVQVLAGARQFLDAWQERHPLVRVGLGPAGPERCTDDLIQGTAALAAEYGIPFQMHLCETKAQAVMGYHRYGCSIVAHLDRLGVLGPHLSLAHAVWISQEDINRLARTGAKVVHNPLSNLRLGSGIAPIQSMRDAGVTVALGADGPGSGDSLDVFEIVKLTALVHKLYGDPADWVSAQEALEFCWLGGAAVLEQDLGRVAPGAAADLALLDGESYFHLADNDYMLRQLVYCQPGRTVDTVLVGGEVVADGGHLTAAVNLADIRLELQDYVDRMAASLPQRQALCTRVRSLLDGMLRRVAGVALPYNRLHKPV